MKSFIIQNFANTHTYIPYLANIQGENFQEIVMVAASFNNESLFVIKHSRWSKNSESFSLECFVVSHIVQYT